MIDLRMEALEHPVGRVVLRAECLHLRRGVRYGLVGANGSGKTTLLRILALLVRPVSGRLTFDGGPPSRRHVTLALQHPFLLRGRVLDNVSFGLRARGLGRAEAEAAAIEALRVMGLDGFAPRSARALSAGESQRLSVARALALRTPVLLMDEPFAALDEAGARAVRSAMACSAAHRPTTVIAALDLADGPFDEIVTIRDGQVRQAS